MLPALSVLIEIQALDTAIDAARKTLNDYPIKEKSAGDGVTAATAALNHAKQVLNDATAARRVVEKDIAGIDTRLARFEEHKASVKTNEQFHALQHETQVSLEEKAGLEEKVLEMLMAADGLAANVKTAEGHLATANAALAEIRAQFAKEKGALEAEIARLSAERATKTPSLDKATLARYEQVRKARKGLAVAELVKGHCVACHMGVRPAVETQIKRNDTLIQCDSCQRILYYVAPPAAPAEGTPA